MRVAMVGAGYVSHHHLRAVRDLGFAEIVGICDSNEERARATAAKFGVANVYRTLHEMSAARPEVIHILTPPESHCALTLEALDMGCHVLVEKPLAESIEECERMIAKARQTGRVLSVNHSARFDPVVLEGLERIARGEIGEVLSVHIFRSSDYPPYGGGPLPAIYRQGSYPYRDLGVHCLYVLESFLGPVSDLDVRYQASGRDPNLTFDEWRMLAECERGTGHVLLSWNARPIVSEIWVHGTRGVLRMDSFLQICERTKLYPGPKVGTQILNGMIHAAARLWRIPRNVTRFATGSLKPSPGIYRSVQEFHLALKAGKPVPVSPEEGLRTIHLISEAAARADREKEERDRPIPVPSTRLAVTGGSGFLGSRLVARLLAQGESPRLLLRRRAKPGSLQASLPAVLGNLGEPDVVDRLVEGAEIVIHVGAAMRGGAASYQEGTIIGTRNIIESCLRHKVKRLVYVSSMGLLDHAGHKQGEPVNEQSALEPYPARRGFYTQAKLEAEQLILTAVRERGLPAVIVRPGQIFGPGSEKTTPNGVFGLAGRWILAGGGNLSLPLVYVEDVVDGLIQAMTAETAPGKIIHLVDDAVIRQNDYLKWSGPANPNTPVIRTPVWILWSLGAMCDVMSRLMKRDLPLSRYRIKSLRPLSPIDGRTAREVLGWRPAVGAEEGLRRTFAGYLIPK
jgi:predicted dehydrogenase/nucleoside-diphosphate-sugar epimerase